MSTLTKLQDWYLAQCDGSWEHSSGVSIGTLDNPGWALVVDLEKTVLSGRRFPEQSYGVTPNAETSGNDWLHCEVKDNKFSAVGGPTKLEEMINVFLAWADAAA